MEKLHTHEEETKKILCFDRDENSLKETRIILEGNGFVVETATTLGQALEKIVIHNPAVILTEIMFDELSPAQTLRAIRRQANNAVVIIYTEQAERRKGADRRLGAIFEYIEKPASPPVLISHIRRAVDFYREKFLTITLDQENEAHMRSQLEWLIWKEQSRISDKIRYGKEMIENIRNSISQGMGVGGLITLLDLLSMLAKKNGNEYTVPAETMELFFKTGHFVRGWLDNLEAISDSFSKTYSGEIVRGSDLNLFVKKAIENVEKFRLIKDQTIQMEDLEIFVPITGNRELLELTFRELLTNAFKYSPEKSVIHIARFRTDNHFSLIVVNDIITDGSLSGIPKEVEHDVFEPFFKLNTFVDERFHEEEFGMGIGLTVVHSAIAQIGGKIRLFEITDHVTEKNPRQRVVAEIILKVYEEAERK